MLAVLEAATHIEDALPGVVAVGLAGSWARGTATVDSDVDLIVLLTEPAAMLLRPDWFALFDPQARLVRAANFGAIDERRLRLPDGLIVEVGIGEPSWADIDPADAGTRRVVSDGLMPLADAAGLLARLIQSVAPKWAVQADPGKVVDAGLAREGGRPAARLLRPPSVAQAGRVTASESIQTTQTPSDVWWRNAVVYQVYPRSFADSNGDGIGDIPGIVGKLDYLADLGVEVLWVSPFYTSPMDDNGYDISDYRDVDPIFGTLADLDQLIAGLHERGMKLMIDVVVNHTSDDHPWFQESRASTDNPKRDWYWWAPPRAGMAADDPGAEPTNWQSAFSGPAWTLDDATGQYYLHLFSRRQPDLNWENADVRAAVYEMLRWWVDRGVDGFRMDVINFISKKLPLADVPALPGGTLGDGHSEFVSGPRIHEFLHELNAEAIAGRPTALVSVGEMPGATVDDAVLFTDPARAEVDMVFQFEHVALDHGPGGKYDPVRLSLVALKTSLNRWQTGLAERGWNSLYWNNHDQPRAVSRFGSNDERYRVLSAKLLATVLHLHRGTPYIYQGEELGMTNFPFAALGDFADIEAVNYYHEAIGRGVDEAALLAAMAPATRDNARTPMQWDASAQAGFTTGQPWLAVNPNYVQINAAAQTGDDASVFAHYRRLIALRHELAVVALGDFTMLLPAHEQIYAFTRRLDSDELLVLANFSSEPVAAQLDDDWTDAELLLGNHANPPENRTSLRPWEAVVYRRTA